MDSLGWEHPAPSAWLPPWTTPEQPVPAALIRDARQVPVPLSVPVPPGPAIRRRDPEFPCCVISQWE